METMQMVVGTIVIMNMVILSPIPTGHFFNHFLPITEKSHCFLSCHLALSTVREREREREREGERERERKRASKTTIHKEPFG